MLRAALTLGWPLAAAFSGRFYLRIGFKNTALIGISLVVLGTLTVALFAPNPPIVIVAIVTGTNLFARSIGSAIGVAIFGAIANSIFGAGDAASLPPATITAGSAAVFVAVLVVAAATVVATTSMPRTPVERAAAA